MLYVVICKIVFMFPPAKSWKLWSAHRLMITGCVARPCVQRQEGKAESLGGVARSEWRLVRQDQQRQPAATSQMLLGGRKGCGIEQQQRQQQPLTCISAERLPDSKRQYPGLPVMRAAMAVLAAHCPSRAL